MDLATDGAELVVRALDQADLHALLAAADDLIAGRPGERIFGDPLVQRLCAPAGVIGRLAQAHRFGAKPVRAVLFDKTPANNWAVAWHQDRTIAVKQRSEVEGFGPWSSKGGLQHVEPPFAVLEDMLTIRVHLDDCGHDNAPLLIARGSHRIGRVAARDAAVTAVEMDRAACVASAGDVWIYATPILHASEQARRPGRRRVLQVDFAAAELPGGLEWAGI